MEQRYNLYHKDKFVGIIYIDNDNGALVKASIINKKYAPFLGNADNRLMKKWWEARAVPGNREIMNEIILKAGCINSKMYLAKNLALSITDTYWICPINMKLKWEDVNLYNTNRKIITYHNATSYDPNASLGGQMNKVWDMSKDPPVMKKIASLHFGQQSINELFATKLHEKQKSKVPYVKYSIVKKEGDGIQALCNSFTNQDVELVPAFEVIEAEKGRNDTALYDKYIEICVKNGIEERVIRDFMDYQTLTDFIISNADEHLMNFGVLRNADTMQFIAPAPIYDSGNSMFYNDDRSVPYTRSEILNRKVASFYEKEERALACVKNKEIVDYDRLPDPEDVKALYIENGLPEKRAAFIAKNYMTKRELFKEFQKGKTIKYYLEKLKEDSLKRP